MSKTFWILGGLVVAGLLGIVSTRSIPSSQPVTPQVGSTAVSSTSSGQLSASTSTTDQAEEIVTHDIHLKNGKQFSLSLPTGYDLSVVAEGYKRLRFMALSPDQQLFVGEMFSASDDPKGRVIVLSDFDQATHVYRSSHVYADHLRNPNSVAFYTDASGQTWLYVALTDSLIRYAYTAGDIAPHQAPQVITTFPTYARPWSEGGGHITRTVVVYENKIYVSVGSSCNSCEEKADEPVRASVLVMDPDGKNVKILASGLRNAVGLQWVNNELFMTVNGPDHLGFDRPEDTFAQVQAGTNYGWPYCYQLKGKVYADTTQKWMHPIDCATVPVTAYGFDPHSAPLGFDAWNGSFYVALHGSGKKTIGTGYKVVALQEGTYRSSDFLTGFLKDGTVLGRPVGILKQDDASLLVTDDFNGVIYLIQKTR